jgi:TonB family protein
MRAVLLLLAFLACDVGLAQEWNPSIEGWARRVNAAIRPRIHHPDGLPTDIKIETQIQLSLRPDGSIESFSVLKPSGIESWDTAVLAAVRSTERLPLPTQWAVPSRVIMHFRPR